MQGLKSPKYQNSEVMHPLIFLSYIAWNRTTFLADYMEREYKKMIADFAIPDRMIRRELISTDWGEIMAIMIEYKEDKFPDDKRVITACGFTPQNTLRVEWK